MEDRPLKFLFHHRIASRDGQSVHMDELINALRQIGHEVVIVGPNRTENTEFGSEAGFIDKLKKILPQSIYELLEFGYNLKAMLRLYKAIKKEKPDIIYERYNLYFLAGVWLKKRFNLKLLLEVNSPLFEERLKNDGIGIKSLAYWTEKKVWKKADVILPVTDVLADYGRKIGIPEDKIKVIPNGINYERFSAIEDTESAKEPFKLENQLVLGFIGFIRSWHKLDQIIAELPNLNKTQKVHLLIVGDGPAKEELLECAKKHNIESQVTITGIVDRDSVAKYVAAFDIALQPGVTSYASPLKLFEYMAMQRAIIAPDTPNIREVLTDKVDSVLFDPNQEKAFINTIVNLCENSELRNKIGGNAAKTIKEKPFTWLHNAETVVELSQNLIRRKFNNLQT
ncbi:MAG: glycosyltransferase family 1 protein [Gammaproteobacteria bacterium]|nr:MAG: glycosyltransferase family 1 protein [Gammaproteobacteria bacterium]